VKKTRLALHPGQVLLAGLIGAVLWTATLSTLVGISGRETVLTSVAGIIGAVSGTCGALIQAHRARAARDVLLRAEHEANHDALTNLLNRNALIRQLDDSIITARQNDTVVGVLFLDLDRFKVINDSMGHEAGDELLRIVAERLLSTVRSSDLVARFGGDEFLVVVRGLLNQKSVIAVVEQILHTFESPVSLFGGAQVISTSIGVAIARPGETRRGDDLVRDADAAMYKAKRSRSGYALFDDQQRAEAVDRLDIERDLVRALDEKQLIVFFQPLVDVTSRRLYAFEALVRWNHPTRGLIGPGSFLGVAEETGMMAEIGEYVLREATAQAAVWNHLNPNARQVKMSVNIAEQQLIDKNFPDAVAEVLSWSGLPPDQLVLEITEDVIVDHLDGLSVLNRIRDLGVALAIDDFGTGQSSLSYIKQFDMVSTLKIDQVFVREMGDGDSNRAIIEAVVAMAKALDLRVVAEGVENIDQVNQLRAFGIEIMQGYLFNAPVAANGIDPAAWFVPEAPSTGSPPPPPPPTPGLSPLEVSRGLAAAAPRGTGADPRLPVGLRPRPARRG
jgi:diguanylate cyclase (GGDEF)-like protein